MTKSKNNCRTKVCETGSARRCSSPKILGWSCRWGKSKPWVEIALEANLPIPRCWSTNDFTCNAIAFFLPTNLTAVSLQESDLNAESLQTRSDLMAGYMRTRATSSQWTDLGWCASILVWRGIKGNETSCRLHSNKYWWHYYQGRQDMSLLLNSNTNFTLRVNRSKFVPEGILTLFTPCCLLCQTHVCAQDSEKQCEYCHGNWHGKNCLEIDQTSAL